MLTRRSHIALKLIVFPLLALLACCGSTPQPPATVEQAIPAPAVATDSGKLRGLDLDDLSNPQPTDGDPAIAASKNEWTNVCLRVAPTPGLSDGSYSIRLGDFSLIGAAGSISSDNASLFQILAMPVDVNRAGYVRHTGQSTRNQLLPRALFPIDMKHGQASLSSTRGATSGQSIDLWIDLHIPPEAKAGHYRARCDVIAPGQSQAVGTTSIDLTVYDFVLPDDRHLMMVGQLKWEDLTRLYADRFEAVTPRFVNRADDRYQQAVKTMDELVALAQLNRTQLVIDRLQPIAKWPTGGLQLSWQYYDSLVSPWLKGDVFPDKVGFGFWPMPPDEHLANYDPASQRNYWRAVGSHFDQQDWINRSAVVIEPDVHGRSDALESVKLSADAAAVLGTNPATRVVVPLEDDQVAFAGDGAPNLIQPTDAARLITSNPGLVFTSPIQNWPANVARPKRWLRTDLAGLIPYVGAGGDERDVRLWSWLATIPLPPPPMGAQYGPVQFIRWPAALPQTSTPAEAADPSELVWFYPGSWFGVDKPVPTVQLKWLRRAQQDYEYLYLARQRGDTINSLLMARLITKPVEFAPNQTPDPTYGLMSGTTNPKAWTEAIDLLAQRILIREPGQTAAQDSASNLKDRETELNLRTLRWIAPQEKPVIMGRSSQWLYIPPSSVSGPAAADVKLGIDIYNASDRTPDENSLQWTDGPAGWHWRPQPSAIPQLATYHVRQFDMVAHVESSEVSNVDHRPQQLTFTDGFTHNHTTVRMVLPASISERREGRLHIDGSLEDWSADDAIQLSPLVKMFDRPSLQDDAIHLASTPSQIYTGWADENFYVAFKVSGISGGDRFATKNWIGYEFRRAWGEDVCQIVMQPVYADGTLGPTMNVALKPNGGAWVEREMDRRMFSDPWQPIEGSSVRYAPSVDGSDWRREGSRHARRERWTAPGIRA